MGKSTEQWKTWNDAISLMFLAALGVVTVAGLGLARWGDGR